MKTIIITMALAGIAFAYDLPKPPTSAGDLAARLAAKITPEQRAGFWRAQAEWISVSTQAQARQSEVGRDPGGTRAGVWCAAIDQWSRR